MDDTDEMVGNECEHFSAWKLKKHLELLQKVSINSILKGFILTMLQALKDHQFLHDNYNAQQLHMEYMKGSGVKESTGHSITFAHEQDNDRC